MRARSIILTAAAACAVGSVAAAELPARADGVFPATLGGRVAHAVMIDLTTPIPVSRFHVEAFGPSCTPTVVRAAVPDHGIYLHQVEIAHGGLLALILDGPDGADLSLRVYGPSGRLVALSEETGPDHAIAVRLPADGTWRIEVAAARAPAGWAEFDLTVDAVQGGGVDVAGAPAGPIAAGEPIHVVVHATQPSPECPAQRVLLVYGPPGGENQDLTLILPAQAIPLRTHRIAATTASR